MNGEGRIETRETLPELPLNKGVRNRPWELDLPLRLLSGRSVEKDILLGQTHLKKMTLDELVNEGHPFKRERRGMGFLPCEEKKPANAEKGTEKKEESVADPASPSLPFRSTHFPSRFSLGLFLDLPLLEKLQSPIQLEINWLLLFLF
jgi:hypothetical protein